MKKELQTAILQENLYKVAYFLKEIEENSISINLYTTLNMATLHSTPEIVELLMDELSLSFSEHILAKTFDNINTGKEKYFENYKIFIKKALPKMSSYLIEQKIEDFCNKNSENKYEVLYKEEFLKVLKNPCFKSINNEFIDLLRNNIKKEKLKLSLEDF